MIVAKVSCIKFILSMPKIYSLNTIIFFTKKKEQFSSHERFYQKINSHEKSKSFFFLNLSFDSCSYFQIISKVTHDDLFYSPATFANFPILRCQRWPKKNDDIMDGKIIWHTWLLFF